MEALVDSVGKQPVVAELQHAERIALPWRRKKKPNSGWLSSERSREDELAPKSTTVQISSQQVCGLQDFDLQETNVAQVLQRAFQMLGEKRERAALETSSSCCV